jgi:hypothetical protein
MPSVQEVTTVAAVAAEGVERVAPALAEKIAADLPEIFGGSANDATRAINAAHLDAHRLANLGHSFQSNLERFGLPRTANPADLFASAQEHGLANEYHDVVTSKSNSTTTQMLFLGDGNLLEKVTTGGRGLSHDATSFLTRDGSELTFNATRALGQMTENWELRAGQISGK